MSEGEYSIESLIKTFGKHHQKMVKDTQELFNKIESGEVEFQEWMKVSFSISLALQVICKEIKELKSREGK